MIRPLYLDGALAWQVRLDDGPSLNVSAPGRARSLYPLQRLARVVCPSQAQWTTPALLACLGAGVPVVFHDAAGEPLAWCFGPRKRETTLGSLLREALAEPRGAAAVEAWRLAADRREIMAALSGMGAGLQSLDPGTARARLCNLHRVRFGQAPGRWLRALGGANAALVAECLHAQVGDPALIGFASEGLHLGKTLCGLMDWRLHGVLYRTPLLAITRDGSTGRFAAQALERDGGLLHSACGDLIGRLERHLRELLT